MRRFQLPIAAIAMGGFAAAAYGADMPTKAPVYEAPVVAMARWTGCYVGGNVGGGWNALSSFGPAGDQGTADGSGFVGGGQIGCDYQINTFVVGIQGMFDGAAIKGSGPNPSGGPLAPQTNNLTIPWFTTLTGRVGVAVTPSTLIYAKGGAAWLKDNGTITLNTTGQLTVAPNYTANGWTLGGGIEYLFASHWSAFAEYNYAGFGTITHHSPLLVAPFTTTTGNITQNVQTAIVGVNYRF